MRVGDRIYYTGDMSNGSSTGTITACNPATKYAPESVDIKFDESRCEGDTMESRMVFIKNFAPGPGRRFYMLDEWRQEREISLKAMQERYLKKS